MVSAPPSALECDPLDVVEVHGDGGDIAGKAHAAAIGRDVDIFGGVGAVEDQRVGAGLTFDGVVAVAGIPDVGIVVGAKQSEVVAASAGDGIVAIAAEQRIAALAAGDDVVAGAAIDRQPELTGRESGGVDDIVAAEPVDDKGVVGAFLA